MAATSPSPSTGALAASTSPTTPSTTTASRSLGSTVRPGPDSAFIVPPSLLHYRSVIGTDKSVIVDNGSRATDFRLLCFIQQRVKLQLVVGALQRRLAAHDPFLGQVGQGMVHADHPLTAAGLD